MHLLLPKSRKDLLIQTLDLLRRYKVKPRKRLSQNFMVDPKIAYYFLSRINSGSTVLEVGAGIGNLTIYLASKAKKVIAIEVDKKLARILRDRIVDLGNVEVVEGDYLKLEAPRTQYLVSNTPYHISSKVLFKAIREGYEKILMSFQKEFAERLLAKPGTKEYGRLTVMVSVLSRVEVIKSFDPRAFYPPPKVETTLVEITPKRKVRDLGLLDEVLRVMFSQKNKLAYKPLSTFLKRYGLLEEFLEECSSLYGELSVKKVRDLEVGKFLEVVECIGNIRRS